jgi:hypothetical protein
MNKETLEVGALLGKTINAVVKSLEDGKLNLQDLGNFLDPVFAAQPAIDGIKLVGFENANMTIPEREATKKGFSTALTEVNDSLKHDLTEVFGGVLAVMRVGYNLGQKEGERRALEDIAAGKVAGFGAIPDAE